MIYSLSGIIKSISANFIVIETGGMGYKIFVSQGEMKKFVPETHAHVFTHFHVGETEQSLYGFTSEYALHFFELLISVSGVGPKSALSIMDVADLDQLQAAIKEGRSDLLTRASGIGAKTAARIIIELKEKVAAKESASGVKNMETDMDLIEGLTSLGYRREEAKVALGKVDHATRDPQERLKAALRILKKN